MTRRAKNAGKVLRSLAPGAPGTRQWQERYGNQLVQVRYRGNPERRVRSITVEIVVEEAYWEPEGHQAYESAMTYTPNV